MRHCRALFKKQVLPRLCSPEPMLHWDGHEISMPDDHRDFEDDLGVGAGVRAEVGGDLGSTLFYDRCHHYSLSADALYRHSPQS